MAGHDFDLGEAAGAVWKIGAGVALIMGFGAMVRSGSEAQPAVRTTEGRYVRDSVTGRVSVLVRIESDERVWLHGCPRAPVLLVQRKTPRGWMDDQRLNHFCSGSEQSAPMLVQRDKPETVVIVLDEPGRYRVSVPRGINWKWSRTFTVR